ncbi:hypothetical protein TWF694_006124 [Orbilia ellipsospora]|uniref:Uncharacterized protein n=1 Tax=Orbilia ellipsospora TaxID=2528407 RepID=A0AAV9WSA3_9PEZI
MSKDSSIRTRKLVGATALLAFITSAHGLLIKVRHYDYDNGMEFDLNLCRPLKNNRIILVDEICQNDDMPGWRARFDDSYYSPRRSVVDLFGPPFSQGVTRAYEENRNFATWGGALYYNLNPWKPLMFRTGLSQEEGYVWRMPFEIYRQGRPVVISDNNPLAVGDVLEPTDVPDDTTMTLMEYPRLVSCETPSGRVLRRSQLLGVMNGQPIVRKYHDADCLDVKLWIYDLGFTDPQAPVEAPFPLGTIPEELEVSSDTGSFAASQQNLDDSQSSSAYGSSDLSGSIEDGNFSTEDDIWDEDFEGSIDEEDDPEWAQLVQDLEQEYGFGGDSISGIDPDDLSVQQIEQYLVSPVSETYDQDSIQQQLVSLDFGSDEDLEDELARLQALMDDEEI